MFAQSVGGGGGVAGLVSFWNTDSFGSGLAMGNGTATSGNGAAVTVAANAAIATSGDNAPGIFAQSVGGGGGVAGTAGSVASGALIGSAGGGGASGTVSVTVAESGSIATTGAQSHGIFAQSAGGAGTGSTGDTTVAVTVNGNVIANGNGSHGIFAQSAGDGMGAIDVTVASGAMVQGGGASAIPGVEDGAGIFVRNGTGGTINNAGTIASSLGTDGVAINVVDTVVTIDNSGTIDGQILKASGIDLLNRPGGRINAGMRMQVDSFRNRGTLSVGGPGLAAFTELSGNLVQSDTGILEIDLDPSIAPGLLRSDTLVSARSARLAGAVDVRLSSPFQYAQGKQSELLVTTQGSLDVEELVATKSAVAQYALFQPTEHSLALSYDIDFNNAGIRRATNDNQDDVTRHINDYYLSGAMDEALAMALIGIEDPSDFAHLANTLGPEVSLDNQIVSLFSSHRFSEGLLSCAERSGAGRFFDEGQCGWVRADGTRFSRDESGDNLGFDTYGWEIAAGGQIDLENGWFLGGSLAYGEADVRVQDSDVSSDGSQIQIGLSAKRRIDNFELAGSLATGWAEYDIDRTPTPGSTSSGRQKIRTTAARLRAAMLLQQGAWTLRPRIDFGATYVSAGSFNEFRRQRVERQYGRLQQYVFRRAAGHRFHDGVRSFGWDARAANIDTRRYPVSWRPDRDGSWPSSRRAGHGCVVLRQHGP